MMISIVRIEIRCDLLGPPNCSVFSMGTETTKENRIKDVKRLTVLYHSCEFPRSDHHRQILLVGISLVARLAVVELQSWGSIWISGSHRVLSLHLYILCI